MRTLDLIDSDGPHSDAADRWLDSGLYWCSVCCRRFKIGHTRFVPTVDGGTLTVCDDDARRSFGV